MKVYQYIIKERRTLEQWKQILSELRNAGNAFYEIYGDLESLIYDIEVSGLETDRKFLFSCSCSRSAYEEYMQITEGLFNEEHD